MLSYIPFSTLVFSYMGIQQDTILSSNFLLIISRNDNILTRFVCAFGVVPKSQSQTIPPVRRKLRKNWRHTLFELIFLQNRTLFILITSRDLRVRLSFISLCQNCTVPNFRHNNKGTLFEIISFSISVSKQN